MLETGDILVGRYEVDSLLGRGGMSSVFSGWDRTLGREVAIKVLAAELVEDRVFVERFDREARAAASLSHRNIVAVFDSGVDDDARFIVMERVSGKTLAAVLREGPMSVEQAVEIAVSVSQALGAAHVRGIVHRDVKPGNVMLGDNGQVKVLDFGIARALAATSLTRAFTVIGTAGYLSPEQAEGGPVDARSDLYGLGCLLYEMLTGRPPFVADSAAALVHQHLTRPPDRPSRWRPEVSPALDETVLRCLAKDPGERYARADALSADLIGGPATRNAAAGAGTGPTSIHRPRRERRWIAALALAMLAAALLVLFALDHGPAGHSGGATAKASAAAPAHAAANDPKPATATDSRRSAETSATGPSSARAAQASGSAQAGGSADPAAAAAALSALTLADRQQGLIDRIAASVISRRTAALLNALAAGDPNEVARRLSQFNSRVDTLAARGEIATSATAVR
jgi:predicted Ser/Thr protein kinase